MKIIRRIKNFLKRFTKISSNLEYSSNNLAHISANYHRIYMSKFLLEF